MPIRRAYLSIALLFGVLVLAKFDPVSGFTVLIRFGEQFQHRALAAVQGLPVAVFPNSAGYDGQFYAQIALDPTLRNLELDQALDSPAYRAKRILVSACAWILGFGNPWLTLNVFALLNAVCWFAFAWVIRDSVGADKPGFARWLGCVLSLGVLDSVRMSLVDLPALLLIALALRQAQSSRPVSGAVCFALAALTKETSLLGALAAHWRSSRTLLRTCIVLILIAGPFILWSAYVNLRFSGQTTDGFGNFTWPLLAMFNQLKFSLEQLMAGELATRHIFTPLAVLGFAVQLTVIWRHRQPDNAWWRIGAIYSVLFLFLGAWVWSGYWAVCRAVLPLTIAFNLLLPINRAFWPLWFAGNLTVLHGVWRFL